MLGVRDRSGFATTMGTAPDKGAWRPGTVGSEPRVYRCGLAGLAGCGKPVADGAGDAGDLVGDGGRLVDILASGSSIS